MTWYYVRGQERVGPVDSSQFNALISDGTIAPDTLVWRDGMAKWQRFGELGDMAATGEESTEAVCSQTVRANPVCAECGQVFPADDMIRYDNQWVCATCKPIFFQRVKEGALTGALRYAGFWIRFAAVFLDGILTGIVTQILGLMIGIMVGVSAGDDPNAAMVAGLLGFMIGIAIPCAYETILVGKYSATLGKMACGVKVMRPDGSQLTYLRAFARYWAKSLSALILLIGYIMAAFDDEKRALHDRVCDTRVVKK